MKRIAVLGSTGSIGTSTLKIVADNPDKFRVEALTAGRNIALLCKQIKEFRPEVVSVETKELAATLKQMLGHQSPDILFGRDGACEVASHPKTDIVVSAIVGASGLIPTIAAINAQKTVALANKETLVMAGHYVMNLAMEKGVFIIPVDSEHSAIFQSLTGHSHSDIKRILLTASGGPFYSYTRDEMLDITPEMALQHPNWSMGAKITIDSSTMMNKGLEVIEASWLFDVPVESIQVIVHPQSIVHSMVEYIDGSVIAQMGVPDMMGPIAYALSFPERITLPIPHLDLFQINKLTFYPPDIDRFPCLKLAIRAFEAGGTMPAVLNAANESAVAAFLDKRLGYAGIPILISNIMDSYIPVEITSLDHVLSADKWARDEAEKFISNNDEPLKREVRS